MRLFSTLSFVFGCTALLGACAAGRHPPDVALSAAWDSPIVSVAEQAVGGASTIDRAWPGFWNPPAFAIYRPDSALYLFSTDVAPVGFKPVNDARLPAVLRHSFFVLEGSFRGLRGGGVVPIDPNAQRLAMAVRLPYSSELPLEFLLHESFHGWQFRNFANLFDPSLPQHLPDSLRLPGNRHLLQTERRLLVAALASTSNSRQAVRDYLGARRARLADSPPLAGRIEEAAERVEGTAEYVGLFGALVATDLGMATVVDSIVARIQSDERWGSDARTPREHLSTRAYRTGSAMALLLDRLRCDDWRARVSAGASLDAQLGACIGPP